jgi:asparagine synthase (glutamine-hydrolysing)
LAGIAGIVGSSVDKGNTSRMLNSIKHRGPDLENYYQMGTISAGVVASKLSSARGDGFAKKGNRAVLLDGEIYNTREKGVSDAEVVLELYNSFGWNFPAYMDGIFACAVIDGERLILARDSVGIRPLYWGTTAEGNLCFASEMKSLVGVADQIQELRPSTTFSSSNGLSEYIPRYPEVLIPEDFNEAAEKLRELIFKAVERRLEDDAVGGCFLSGGLDSSIIAALMSRFNPSLPAFTVGIEGAPDLKNANIMAEYLGIEHNVYTFSSREIRETLQNAVITLESFDEDCIMGAIANLIASAYASKYTNCLLSGEGGDELFGGYHLLKDLPTDSERLQMMKRLIAVAYNTAVQRLDRAMMGNSINYRIPFLDTEVTAYALQLPVRWKIHPQNVRQIEKYILREAFKDMLPEEIYTREKLRFSRGTGTENLIDEVTDGLIDATDFNEESRATEGGYYLNSPRELLFYRIFKHHFPSPGFENLVGRWDPYK